MMCTPENLRMNCSCPHLVARDLRRAARAAGVLALAAGIWLVATTVPWWMLATGAWVTLMGMVALVRLTRGARATGTGTAGFRSAATGRAPRRTTPPGETVPVAVPARASAAEWLPARTGHPG